MSKIRIYADNACDLDKELIDSLGVKLFYLTVTIKDVIYHDRLDLSPGEFYKIIAEPGVMPTTSQVSIGDFQQEFQKVIDETEDEIIYVAFSSGISGTYQAACLARDQVDASRITVIDTKSASVGYGLTVIRAARAAAQGMSKVQIIAEIEDNIKKMQHVFIVGSFEMLKRGGRVSSTTAALGNLLNIKLLLHFVDGKIVPLEKAHGIKKAKRRLLDLMEERGYDLPAQTIGICYSADLKGALELKEQIAQRFGCEKFVISEIGAVIGSHVGAGTYSVFFLTS
ncbi:MAG TPA: DegV family protein [Syntrophomonadaceae bacterium]|nr:DegV family protein [Syntrophomonadaceae bacterium]